MPNRGKTSAGGVSLMTNVENGSGGHDSLSTIQQAQTMGTMIGDDDPQPVPEFVSPDQVMDYLCVFCKKVAIKDPHQALLCACRMCHACVSRHISDCGAKGEPAMCPGNTEDCGTQVLSFTEKRKNRVVRDRAAINDLELLHVYCPNRGAGCQWTGQWSDSKDHVLEKCDWVKQPCPDCKDEVFKKQLESHLVGSCRLRKVRCENCAEELTFESLEQHLDVDCKKNSEACEHCHELIRKHRMDAHLKDECLKRLVRCEFMQFGCPYYDTFENLAEHNKVSQDAHMKMLMAYIPTAGQTSAASQQEIDEMKAKLSHLEQKVAELTSDFSEFSVKLDQVASSSNQARQDEMTTLREEFTRLSESFNQLRTKSQSADSANEASAKRGDTQSGEHHSQAIAAVDGGEDGDESRSHRVASPIDMTSFNGILIWKTSGFRSLREDTQRKNYVDSPPFFTSKFGYKMMARLYPNGDGSGRGTHLSLFFVLLRGEFDDLLSWPFRQKVTFVLLDQDSTNPKNVIDTFRPDPNSVSFRKPSSEMNQASGCPSFVPHKVLQSKSSYLNNDTLYLKIIVDTTDLFYP